MSEEKTNGSQTGTGTGNLGICPTCGKPRVYVGDVPQESFAPGLEPYCTCGKSALPKYDPKNDPPYLPMNPPLIPYVQQGWICPRCGRGNAPWVSQCPCLPAAYGPKITF